jgi:hypothetical protein
MATTLLLDTVGRDVTVVKDPLNYLTPVGLIDGWTANTTEVRAIPADPSHSVPDFASSVEVREVTLPYPRVELWGAIIDVVDIAANVISTDDPVPPDGTVIMTSAGKWGDYGISPNVTYYVVGSGVGVFSLSLIPAGPPEVLVDSSDVDLTLTIVTPEVLEQLKKAKTMYSTPHIVMRLSVHSESDNNRIRHYQTSQQTIGKYQFVLERSNTDVDEVTFTPTWIRYRALQDQVLRWNLKKPIHIGFATIKGTPIDVYCEDKRFPTYEDHAREWKRSIIVATVIPYAREAKFSNHFTDIRE